MELRCTTPRVLSFREAACPPYLLSRLESGLRDSEASSMRGRPQEAARRVDLADLLELLHTLDCPGWLECQGERKLNPLSKSLLLSSLLKQLNQYTLTASRNNWLFIMHTYWCPENMRVKLEPSFSLKCHLFLPLNQHNPPLSSKGLFILGSWPRIL